MQAIPQPKPPHLNLPNIRSLPNIPFVGCSGGNATSYIGQQFSGLPDLKTVLHIKALKKSLEEQIYALIQGQLPVIPRAPVYAARAAQLTSEVAQLVSTMTTVISQIQGEINGAISAVNGKIGEVNAAKAAIQSIPVSARTATQQLAIQRYSEYAGELNAQVGRLQQTLSCLGS